MNAGQKVFIKDGVQSFWDLSAFQKEEIVKAFLNYLDAEYRADNAETKSQKDECKKQADYWLKSAVSRAAKPAR